MSARPSRSPSLRAEQSSSPTSHRSKQSADPIDTQSYLQARELASASSSPKPTSPTPSLPPSQGSTPPPTGDRPPPWKLPTSNELAFICSLPVPTVRQLADPRHEPAAANTQPALQSPDAQPWARALDSSQASTTGSLGSNASQDSPQADPPHYIHDPHPDPNSTNPLPFQPPRETILGSASRQWQGMTAQGVHIQRHDTWIIGQGWGRHVRVFEGKSSTSSRRSSEVNEPQQATANRQRTW